LRRSTLDQDIAAVLWPLFAQCNVNQDSLHEFGSCREEMARAGAHDALCDCVQAAFV